MAAPLFEEVGSQFSGLFVDDEKWNALVADPDEPFVEVPDPTFDELIKELTAKLPAETVGMLWRSVKAEHYVKGLEVRDGAGDDGPVCDTDRAGDTGAEVVDGDGGGDPPVQAAGEGAGGGGEHGSGES